MAKFSVSVLAIVTFLLTLMGVAVVVMSGVLLDKVISHKSCETDDSPPKHPNGTDISPPPPPASPSTPPSSPKHQRKLQEVYDTYIFEDSIPSMTFSRHLLSSNSSSKLTASDKEELYYAVGPLMILGFLILLAGISGMMATCDTGFCAGCNLFFHKVFLVLAILLQCAIYIYIAVLKDDVHDKTNCLKKLKDTIKDNGLIVGSIVLAIQLIDLYLVFCVVTSRSASHDDDDDDFSTGRPLLPRTRDLKSGGSKEHSRPSSQSNSAWNQRMREKYGLDTSSLAEPAQDRPGSKPQKGSSSCTIM